MLFTRLTFLLALASFALAAYAVFGPWREVKAPPAAVARVSIMDPTIDTWAGLSTPVRQERPGKRARAKTCLALNIYHEARGEPYEGQVAVAQVTLRRAGKDFGRVCAEVYKPAQFSWAAERELHGRLPRGDAWQWARAAAEEALVWAATGEGHDFSRGATHYAHKAVDNYWTRVYTPVAQVGDHVFYREV